MKIAIIGTGNVGSALGSSLARAGHEIVFAGVDTRKAADVAAKLGATAVASPVEAASTADVIVLAVPFTVAEAVTAQIARAVRGKTLIDATNPLRSDNSGLATEGGPNGAERIAAAAPDARVVKAFNTLFASVQAHPEAHGQVVDALYAGDDPGAKATVAQLIRSIGLRPVDAGPISSARELEAMAWLNISLQLRTGGNWNSAFVLVGAPDKAVIA